MSGGQTGEVTNIARFQEFSRLELPRLVRRTLEVTVEEEAQPLEERLKERLVDIVRECQTQLISLFQSTVTQTENSPPLSLSQLRLPDIENTVESPAMVDRTKVVPTHDPRQHPGPTVPFHNFDSFQSISTVDYIPIPAQYPEHEHVVAKHEPSPPIEGDSNTPDSGYDSTWNVASLPQESYTTHAHETFTQMQSFVPANSMPQEQPQAAYNSGPTAYMESEYVDLGGYYGLFQSRNAGFGPGMMDPSWTYLDNGAGNGGGNLMGQGHGRG